jgi:hypothetical protein
MPVDQRFIDFAFPSSGTTGAVNRTMPARLNDVFNVKDFGGYSGGIANDSINIQKAIDAAIANGGGIVFFPPGGYNIGTRLTVPGTSDCGLIFQGSGGSPTQGGGTELSGTLNDYILYIGHGTKTPVKSIQGISFANNQTGSNVTSTEPTPAGNGRGCLYVGSGNSPSILHCHFSVSIGIAIFCAANNVYISSCPLQGGYGGPGNGNNGSMSDGGQCYGIIFNSGYYGNAKIQACGHGIVILGGPATCENLDIEISGFCIRTGNIPITWWNNMLVTPAIQAAGAYTTTSPTIRNTIGESFAICYYAIENTNHASLLGTDCQALGQIGNAVYGYYLNNVTYSNFIGCSFSGAYQTVGFDMSGGGTGTIASNLLQLVYGSNAPPFAGQPIFANRTVYAAGDNPNIQITAFENDAVGRLTQAQLPPSPTRISTIPIICSDCGFPLWTGSVSNAGRPVNAVAPGSNVVPVRWNGTTWAVSA